MQVLIEFRDPSAAGLRDIARRRVRFVFRRQARLVTRATVRLTDVNGPRGGIDKRCQVALDVGGRAIVVHAMAHDWRVALDDALARAARFLSRLWRRLRGPRRREAPRRAGSAAAEPAPLATGHAPASA